MCMRGGTERVRRRPKGRKEEIEEQEERRRRFEYEGRSDDDGDENMNEGNNEDAREEEIEVLDNEDVVRVPARSEGQVMRRRRKISGITRKSVSEIGTKASMIRRREADG